jgi:hypothetical protein
MSLAAPEISLQLQQHACLALLQWIPAKFPGHQGNTHTRSEGFEPLTRHLKEYQMIKIGREITSERSPEGCTDRIHRKLKGKGRPFPAEAFICMRRTA